MGERVAVPRDLPRLHERVAEILGDVARRGAAAAASASRARAATPSAAHAEQLAAGYSRGRGLRHRRIIHGAGWPWSAVSCAAAVAYGAPLPLPGSSQRRHRVVTRGRGPLQIVASVDPRTTEPRMTDLRPQCDWEHGLSRRSMLNRSATGLAIVLGGSLPGCSVPAARAPSGRRPRSAASATARWSPIPPGILSLPAGFSYTIVARVGRHAARQR